MQLPSPSSSSIAILLCSQSAAEHKTFPFCCPQHHRPFCFHTCLPLLLVHPLAQFFLVPFPLHLGRIRLLHQRDPTHRFHPRLARFKLTRPLLLRFNNHTRTIPSLFSRSIPASRISALASTLTTLAAAARRQTHGPLLVFCRRLTASQHSRAEPVTCCQLAAQSRSIHSAAISRQAQIFSLRHDAYLNLALHLSRPSPGLIVYSLTSVLTLLGCPCCKWPGGWQMFLLSRTDGPTLLPSSSLHDWSKALASAPLHPAAWTPPLLPLVGRKPHFRHPQMPTVPTRPPAWNEPRAS